MLFVLFQIHQGFYIKNRSSGKYFKSYKLRSEVYPVVLRSSIKTTWALEKVIDHWGYITDVSNKNGWVIHPFHGHLYPCDGTLLVVDPSKHWAALFALDSANDHIIHKGRTYATPRSGTRPVGEMEQVTVHKDVHDNMRFSFVSLNDLDKGVHVYGTPTILGNWKMINSVFNPIATHSDELRITIGKSMTESRTTTFQYSWEVTASFEYGAFSGSVTACMQYMMERTSSTTWSEEIVQIREIIVAPGTTAITWQYLFEVQLNLSKSVFQSNFLGDTDSLSKVPADIQIEM